MLLGRSFKIQFGGKTVALNLQFMDERLSAGVKPGLHPRYFCRIGLVCASFEAGSEAHLHFRVDASGKSRIGIQLKGAAPDLEQIERIIHELFRHRPGAEWTVIKRRPAETSDLCCYISAGIR